MKDEPRVSICLPTLNSRRFLTERLESFQQQTLSDWELIAVDSHSDDGTFEMLQAMAAEDSRVQLHQAERDGIYTNLNRSIERGTGEYVYLAPSDDTMPPECLQKMVEALEAHPECDLAHCRLRMIDEAGNDARDWWSEGSIFALSSGQYRDRPHVRRAPYDGLLHLFSESVYVSLTQLLIRRSLFARIGMFETRWGSVGDFNWNMRAALVANTIHVPDTWGDWRLHGSQATAGAALGSSEHSRKMDEMIEHAIASCEQALDPSSRLPLARTRELRAFLDGLAERGSLLARRLFIGRRLLAGSPAARGLVESKLPGGRPWPGQMVPYLVQRWLEEAAGPSSVLAPV